MKNKSAIARNKLLSALLLAGLSWQVPLAAANDSANDSSLQQTVSELGRLNGIALACNQPALTARAREIMIDTVPKERSIGEYFEQATQQSFLAYGSAGKTCPDGKALASQVDEVRGKLRRQFNKTP